MGRNARRRSQARQNSAGPSRPAAPTPNGHLRLPPNAIETPGGPGHCRRARQRTPPPLQHIGDRIEASRRPPRQRAGPPQHRRTGWPLDGHRHDHSAPAGSTPPSGTGTSSSTPRTRPGPTGPGTRPSARPRSPTPCRPSQRDLVGNSGRSGSRPRLPTNREHSHLRIGQRGVTNGGESQSSPYELPSQLVLSNQPRLAPSSKGIVG